MAVARADVLTADTGPLSAGSARSVVASGQLAEMDVEVGARTDVVSARSGRGIAAARAMMPEPGAVAGESDAVREREYAAIDTRFRCGVTFRFATRSGKVR